MGDEAENADGEEAGGADADMLGARVSMGVARKTVAEAREACASTLQFSANLLSGDSKCRVWAGMGSGPSALAEWFAEAVAALKTPRGCTHMFKRLASGSLGEVLLNIFNHITSHEFANLIGIEHQAGERSAYLHRQDSIVLGALWNYTVFLAGGIASTSAYHPPPPPTRFLRLLGTGDERAAALLERKGAWEALLKVEATALVNKDCRNYIDSQLFSLMQFNREIFVQLAEVELKSLPNSVEVWGCRLVAGPGLWNKRFVI